MYVVSLDKISPVNIDLVGIKALKLGISSQKVDVPRGFVVSTLAFRYFLEKNDLKDKIRQIAASIRHDNIQASANKIQKLIVESELPADLKDKIIEAYQALGYDKGESADDILVDKPRNPKVILRTSLIKEIEGLSFPVFKSVSEEKNILFLIKVMFASQYTAKNIIARMNENYPLDNISAVIVQRNIYAEKSIGSCSYNAEKSNFSEIKIKAFYGEFKAFEDKENLSDTYIIDKEKLEIKIINIGEQKNVFRTNEKTGKEEQKQISEDGKRQKLHEEEIIRCARITKELSIIFGKEQALKIAVVLDKQYLTSIEDAKVFIIPHVEMVVEEEKEAPALEVYDARPEKVVEEETPKSAELLYDKLEKESERFQTPIEKPGIESVEELKPVEEKLTPRQIIEEVVNYDEEDDLKEEFDKEEIKVYEDEGYIDLTKKKITPKAKDREDDDTCDVEAYVETQGASDENRPEEETDDSIFSNLKTY